MTLAGLVSATAAREDVANRSSGDVTYTATFAADYVPNVRYERRAVLPITIMLSVIFILAIIFQIIACASNEWASFDHGEKNNWGLWEGCNQIVGCFSLKSPNSLLYISAQDMADLRICQAFSILCVLLLPPAWGVIIMTHKRNYKWGIYGMGVLCLWLICWIIVIVKFTNLKMFDLYSAGVSIPKASFFAAGEFIGTRCRICARETDHARLCCFLFFSILF